MSFEENGEIVLVPADQADIDDILDL